MTTEYIWGSLFWTGFILLFIGIFKPNFSLFWLKGTWTRKYSAIIYGVFTFVTFIGFCIAIGSNQSEYYNNYVESVESARKNDTNKTENTTSSKSNVTPERDVSVHNYQNEFLHAKTDIFYKHIVNPSNYAQRTLFKAKTTSLTKTFLGDNHKTLKNWQGTVESVILLNERGEMTGNDKQDKIIALGVSGGKLKISESEDYFSVGIIQAQQPRSRLKGIYPNHPLYSLVLNLKEGQQIIFTAKVLRTTEGGFYDENTKEHRGFVNQNTTFDVDFIEIKILE